MFDYMPVQASAWADRVDWVNNLITDISVVCTVGITAVMIYFAVKYRKKSDDDVTPGITHNAALETVWTVVPSVVVIFMFYYGFVIYHEMRNPPAGSIEINVDAVKWNWDYSYANGKKSSKNLVVPLGKPVRLMMTSRDVLHSFFLPEMRVKEDVVPGAYSYLWFTPTKLGEFNIFCTEYCGEGHSRMLGMLKVVTPEQFQDFLLDRQAADAPKLSPAEQGKNLFEAKGCMACHSINGTPLIGPSLKGVATSGKRKFSDGTEADPDENYIRQSILNPQAKYVAGFENSAKMPAFEGQLSEDEIKALIAYLKTL